MDESYIHPSALVETKQIGKGTRIWAFSHVMDDVVIGTNCNIGITASLNPVSPSAIM